MNLRLLDRPIAFHRCLAEITGSAAGGLLLSQSIYWQNRCEHEGGWWWKSQPEWHEETFLTRQEFRTARDACSEFLEWKVVGMPAVTHYRVKMQAIEAKLSEPTNQPAGINQLKAGINHPVGRNQPSTGTETPSETSPETTTPLPPSPKTLLEHWNRFKEHCMQSRKPMTDPAEREQWALLKTVSEAEAIATITEAVLAGQTTVVWALKNRFKAAGIANTATASGANGETRELSPSESILRQKELERVEVQIERIRAKVGRDAMGNSIWDPGQREELKRMKDRRGALLAMLGLAA